MTSRAVSVWPYEEARGNQLATQLEAALSRMGALEHKLKLAAEAAAAAAAKHAEHAKGTFDANIAVERAKSLSAKLKESDRRLKDSEMEVTTSRVRQDDMRRRESTAGRAWQILLATSSNAF